ncbi:poly-beta-1,6-N-acetyl-D-glucosamine N-deacetylase precursor [Desulfosporosinus acididurans]|uniref:Poly-beta-1,6-N-acetyl-D-glucosamine N-deacetylase n=1 Tax=Desulfosporosinus acididurans TaxID=476652 RepID=A0A0J1FSL4_9FIRM|nr:polysaccharide deacetylase family protein [Desulfosporosinus acididurans]KLU66469.1 poly-beta-1,6-N-acetyl-D-glucosamine N-deacetylase precursor [Desulfosporosinus acididurans]
MFKKTIGPLILIVLILISSGCTFKKPALNTTKVQASNSSALSVDLMPSSNLSQTPQDKRVGTPPRYIRILYYHSVMREANNEVRMPPEQFEAQIVYLHDHGYHSITLNQLYKSLYQRGALPEKPFVITFDDGYEDNYQTAYPILKKYGYAATVFMISGYINGKGFLTWPQLKELAVNGWDIADHTRDHTYLTKLSPLKILSELESSKKALEKGLGHSVDYFAYPFGDFNNTVVRAVKKAGYLMAFTTLRGWADSNTDAYHVHRVYCYANMGMKEFIHRLQNPNY